MLGSISFLILWAWRSVFSPCAYGIVVVVFHFGPGGRKAKLGGCPVQQLCTNGLLQLKGAETKRTKNTSLMYNCSVILMLGRVETTWREVAILNHQFIASVVHGRLCQFCSFVIHSLRIILVPEMRCRTMAWSLAVTPKMICEWRALPQVFHFREGTISDWHHIVVPSHANRSPTYAGREIQRHSSNFTQDSAGIGDVGVSSLATFLRTLAHTEARQAPAILSHSPPPADPKKSVSRGCFTTMDAEFFQWPPYKLFNSRRDLSHDTWCHDEASNVHEQFQFGNWQHQCSRTIFLCTLHELFGCVRVIWCRNFPPHHQNRKADGINVGIKHPHPFRVFFWR